MLTAWQKLWITAQDRLQWYRAMGKTARDGMPQIEVLQSILVAHRATKHPLAPLIAELLRRMNGGARPGHIPERRTLGTELVGLVPAAEQLLIQAGDSSGMQADGFENAARYVEQNGVLLKEVSMALSKPVVYLASTVALFIYFAIAILPKFEKSRPRASWPASGQVLASIADHIYLLTGGLVFILVAVVLAMSWIVPNWIGSKRSWCDRKVFPFTLIGAMHGSSLLLGLAGFVGAGIPFKDAIMSIRQGASPYMRAQCDFILAVARTGRPAEEALISIPIIHPRYHWIFLVYGTTKDSKYAYRAIADLMTEQTQHFVSSVVARYFSLAMLIALGASLGWIYLSMLGIAAPPDALSGTSLPT